METRPEPVTETTPSGPAAGERAVEELALRIARETPSLAGLSHEELEAVARVVMGQRLVRDLDRRSGLAGIDYVAERETFLAQAGRTGSAHTRRAYSSSVARLEAFAARRAIQVTAMRARDADDFAYALAAEGRAPGSVRRDIAAASSFFSFLERRHEAVTNPFRGTKARPAKRESRPAAYPSEEEAIRILAALPAMAKAAAAVMLYRGLRVGALPSLALIGSRFTARSKGKNLVGTLPAEALAEIRTAELDARRPFAVTTGQRLADAVRYASGKLATAGTIAAPYSAHDLRHLYAVSEYRKDRDIYRVSKLLGHASIQVTEVYLRGLGEVD